MVYDIVTIGSATVDYFVDTDSELIRIDTRTSHEELLAFPLGGKILIKEFNTTPGGGGTNSAVAFSRLGFKTAYLGKIGADMLGDFVVAKLAKANITFIGRRFGQTGVSFLLNSIRDDRTILVYKGVNNFLQAEDIPQLDTPWVYLSSMIGQSWQTVVAYLSKHQFKVAFNPSSYQAEQGYEKLRILTDKVSLLMMNREEACMFLGLDWHEQIDMVKLVSALAKVPGQTTIVTDAANGAWVYNGKQVFAGKPVPALKIAETTGAGDSFASTFTACYIRNMNTADALNYAMTNAESNLQHKGAQEKLLTWEELQSAAQKNSREIQIFNC